MKGGEIMKPIKPVYVIILIIVFAAVGFFGGTMYQKNKASSFAGGAAGYGRRFGGGAAGGASGMTPVGGQIVSTSNGSVTVKLTDGSSKIINISSQTKINKTTSGAQSDLKTGERVTAFGTTNSDGSVTAQAINIGNGAMMMRRGGSNPPAAQSGTQQ